MKDKIKKIAVRVKDHVKNHKVEYVLGGTALLLLNGSVRNQKRFDAFLTEKGINPMEFWTPEYFAELNAA